jgi:hypothetical protein
MLYKCARYPFTSGFKLIQKGKTTETKSVFYEGIDGRLFPVNIPGGTIGLYLSSVEVQKTIGNSMLGKKLLIEDEIFWVSEKLLIEIYDAL